MSTDKRLNKAAVPLVLFLPSSEGGEPIETEFLMTALSDRDMTELDEWVRSRYIDMARKSLPSDATQEQREETMRLAMDRAIGLTFMSGIGARMMATIEGVARLTWQSLRARQPNLTYEQVKAYMFSKENVKCANERWKELNLGGGTTRPATSPGKFEKVRRQRKKKSTGR